MAAEAARVLDYSDEYIRGTAVPARAPDAEPMAQPAGIPLPQETFRQKERARAAEAAQRAPAVSMFAIFGAVFVGILMIFAVLAQINYNELASETVRLNSQIKDLTEQERMLEITFENVVDMKEVERYARDELGMSRPDAEQVAVIQSPQQDSVEITASGGEEGSLHGFGSFISSLAGYFSKH